MKHVVVFVHGWKGKPWSEKYFKSVPQWSESIFCPYSWQGIFSIFPWDDFGNWVKEAKKNYEPLAQMLNSLDADTIDIVAHSLGSRVVHGALSLGITAKINNIYLFGGAFPSSISWYIVQKKILGRIFNFSSSNDVSLQIYCVWLANSHTYNGGTIGRPREGSSETSNGISTRLAKVHNINVSSHKIKHNDYASKLSVFVDLAASLPNRCAQGAWQSSFYWEPIPKFYVSGTKYVRGAKCEIVQVALNNYFEREIDLPVTGYPDDKTVELVKLFQKQHNINVDGIVGSDTWDLLVNRSVLWL